MTTASNEETTVTIKQRPAKDPTGLAVPRPPVRIGLTLLCKGFLFVCTGQLANWVPLFDGKSLEGWSAPEMSYWSVRDGAITGSSSSPIPSNQYLVWQGGRPADFELRLEFRIQGPSLANSGVQFRSKVRPDGFVEGYQADIARYAEHCGVLYDETPGRGLLAKRGQRVFVNETGERISADFADEEELLRLINLEGWNEYRIVARGHWVSAHINNHLFWQVLDHDRARSADTPGVVAVQLHSGPPMTVQFRNIRLRDLTPFHTDRPNPFFAFCMDTHDSKKRNLTDQAALLAELGYAGAGHLWLDGLEERLKTLDAVGLRLFQVYLRLDLRPDANKVYDQRLEEMLPLLRARGVMLAAILSGGKPSDPKLDERAVKILRHLAALAEPYGVRIALYPHVGDWLERVDHAVALAQKTAHPNVGVMFNLCHFLKAEDENDLERTITSARNYLFAVSINGSDQGDAIKTGKGRWIAPLDTGSFDQSAFLRLLRRIGYRGPIGLQCYGIEGDARDHLTASAKAWRMLNTPP
ncbi:MAG: DUF1080 domain-containing protein [Verrucomicrobiae bacterium]|nr:DUF1080 domain-containing protein [Verrucomicrobiae bacterium]